MQPRIEAEVAFVPGAYLADILRYAETASERYEQEAAWLGELFIAIGLIVGGHGRRLPPRPQWPRPAS